MGRQTVRDGSVSTTPRPRFVGRRHVPTVELRPSISSPATPVHRIEGVQLPSTHPHPLFLSLSVHSPSPSRRHGRSLSSSRSPADFASSPPWISNPPHPKLNHLPSSLLNPSNHSHNPLPRRESHIPRPPVQVSPKLDIAMELHRPATISFVQGLKSTVSEPLMLVLPSFLLVHVVSTHVLDEVI